MKNSGKKGVNLRVYYILYVFAILSLSLLASTALSYILNITLLGNDPIAIIALLIVFSVVLGTCAAGVMSKWVLSPITKLSGAMNRVAAGDLSVRLQSNSRISEVRQTYADFNTMAKELSATEVLQSDFVSNVSHEFRTPINAIEGYVMLLQEGPLPREVQSEYVEKILFNTRRLSGLVNSILLLSKVENQAIPTDRRLLFRVDEQIRQALLALEAKWTERETEFDVELEEIAHCASEGLIFHIWINLIDNAIKFGPRGGTVRMRLARVEGGIQFEISDDGPGIPGDAQKHIFDKFYQQDASHKTEGNGLGLSLVRRILDAVGGRIAVDSAPGRGSRFTVILPAENLNAS